MAEQSGPGGRAGADAADGAEAGRRTGRIERETGETSVLVEIDLDGSGVSTVDTGIGFYDHMLAQPARHGGSAPGGRPHGGPHTPAPPPAAGPPAAPGAGVRR